MGRKSRRKNLLEISDQPELWIFSNLLAEKWITEEDFKNSVYQRQVTMPISLPSGTAIFKIESDGTQGEIISVTIAHLSEIHLFQLIAPLSKDEFQQAVLNHIKNIYSETFDFYSYLRPFYLPKLRDFGVFEILGDETQVKDLADYGVKSRILQRISDPIQGYEVPQYWKANKRLVSRKTSEHANKDLICKLRSTICDRLAKHAVIEGLRCAIIALKHYADLLDSMTSEKKIAYTDEYLSLANGLFELGEYQDSAVFYSKCISQANYENKTDSVSNDILTSLKSSIEHLEPQEFLEYALFAAKVARRQDET
ncbi:MAG: hypothetical protein ACTSR4_08010 [Candidatus Hodarchaeales archaeon]